MDKYVCATDVATGKILRKYRGHAGTVNCVKYNEDSSVILSGSTDNSVRIWDCKSRKLEPLQVLDEAKDSVTSIQVSDHEILTGSADGYFRRYDLRTGRMHADFIGKAVSSVSFTKDGQCVLASTLDDSIKLMDKDTGEMLNEFTGHKNHDYKIDSALNCEDTHVISGSEDGLVYYWDLVEAKIVHKLNHGTTRAIHSISHHPEQTCLLTASGDKIFVWKDKYAQSQDT